MVVENLLCFREATLCFAALDPSLFLDSVCTLRLTAEPFVTLLSIQVVVILAALAFFHEIHLESVLLLAFLRSKTAL